MKTKIVEIDGKKVIVGIDESGSIISQYFREDTPPDPVVRTKTPPAEIQDKVQLSAWICSQGYIRGSKEYDEMFSQYRGDMPLEAHPLKDTR